MVFRAGHCCLDADHSINTGTEKRQASNCPLIDSVKAVLDTSLHVAVIVEALLNIVHLFSCNLSAILVPVVKGEILTCFHYWPAQIASIAFFSSSIA